MTAKQQSQRGIDIAAVRGLGEWIVLHQSYNGSYKLLELALLPHKLSLPQLHLLAVLRYNGGMLATGEIGRAMVKSSQTITGLVDRLEDQALVERQFDRRDRRKTWVRLTEAGERKLEAALPVANRLAEEIYSVLTDEELKALRSALEKVRGLALDKLELSLDGL